MSLELKYPVDSANFRHIREGGFVYVDKTEYIHRLTGSGTYYFLARPRRFGKSLFLDTMAEYFKGNRKLFKGLAIDNLQREDWETYPVLRFNLSKKAYLNPDTLFHHLSDLLAELENEFNLTNSSKDLEERFQYLIRRLSDKTSKKLVILIDEYDAPLTSTIGRPQLQDTYREQLHGFYSVLKGSEEYIRFCFLTGVTRYGKVSVFSGLNNLKDITFSNEYAGICGITNPELKENYHEGIKGLAEKEGISEREAYELLKFNYDGYHFSELMLDIYNPYSINNVLADKEIRNYWCQSGVPTILAKSLMENDVDIQKLNGAKVRQESLSRLSLQNFQPIPLFYQTGYLTIKAYDPKRKFYTLGYPNREVEESILDNILDFYSGDTGADDSLVFNLQDALIEGRPQDFIKELSAFLAQIPLDLRKNVGRYENYYHTIFYCLAKLIGLDVQAEYATSEGYVDLLIKTDKYIYVIELKVNGSAEDAMRQIDEKGYCAPFASDKRRLFKVGIGFSKEEHRLTSSLIE